MTVRIPRPVLVLAFAALIFFGLAGASSSCDGNSTADVSDRKTTDDQQLIYNKAQPVHTYNYSMPRDVVQQIYDATMVAHNTWTVFLSYGQVIDICPSVGYPIVGGTQLTNPVKTVNGSSTSAVIAQVEPNGLFPPGSNAGTWVLCAYNGKVEPRYSEPDVITFAHPVKIENGKIVHLGEPSTVNITVRDQPAPATNPVTPTVQR